MESKMESGNCLGWAARDASGVLSPYKFNRREISTDDLSVKIMHCGVCYADFLSTRNKFGHAIYPLVPGHEIVGVVKETGTNVNRFKVGDYVGVGTYVDSCRDCEYCNESREIYCDKTVFTYNRVDKDGTITKGGYSSHIVVHERYCYKIPDGYPLEKAAPLLCAGITVYTPMIKHNMNQPGKSLGIIGLGGLGHMAVKFGKAFGLKVTVISTSKSKQEEAIDLLLADRFLLSTDVKQIESAAKSLDFIIDTASGDHPFDPYLSLLKVDGVMVLVGFPSEIKLKPINLIYGSRCIAGSATGGTKDTEEMLEFCAKNRVYPEVEKISIDYVNEALERLEKRDVKYRFVIDILNSLN
jgi:cinnamyl-alcohol dehydrogenase